MAEGVSVGLALYGEDGSLETDSTDVQFLQGKLVGTAWYVTDAQKCEVLIVAAQTQDGVDLFRVNRQDATVSVAPDRIVDLTRDQAGVTFASSDAAPLTENGQGANCLNQALPALLTLTAADIAGAAEWQLQATADYAKVRQQFDRPIGFFRPLSTPSLI